MESDCFKLNNVFISAPLPKNEAQASQQQPSSYMSDERFNNVEQLYSPASSYGLAVQGSGASPDVANMSDFSNQEARARNPSLSNNSLGNCSPVPQNDQPTLEDLKCHVEVENQVEPSSDYSIRQESVSVNAPSPASDTNQQGGETGHSSDTANDHKMAEFKALSIDEDSGSCNASRAELPLSRSMNAILQGLIGADSGIGTGTSQGSSSNAVEAQALVHNGVQGVVGGRLGPYGQSLPVNAVNEARPASVNDEPSGDNIVTLPESSANSRGAPEGMSLAIRRTESAGEDSDGDLTERKTVLGDSDLDETDLKQVCSSNESTDLEAVTANFEDAEQESDDATERSDSFEVPADIEENEKKEEM